MEEPREHQAAALLDLDLLLSVSAGLGRWESDRAGRRVFRKDDDCTGECFFVLC